MRKLVAVLSMTLLAAVGGAAWMWRELHAERARNDELTARLELLTAPLAVAPHNSPPTASQFAPVSGPVITQTATTESPTAQRGSADEWAAHERRLLADDRYRAAWIDQQRLNYSPQRDNLIRLLGFTPEQADAVIGVMIERELAWQQDTPNTPEKVATDEAAYQDALRNLVGEDQRQRLEHYQESRPIRMQVNQLRVQLTGDDALREAQIEPLIAALYRERAQVKQELEEFRETLRAQTPDPGLWLKFAELQTELMKTMHQRMHDAADSILSRTQLDALDQMLKRELERQEADLRMQRLQSKLSAGADSK
jgi:hypothetical protein